MLQILLFFAHFCSKFKDKLRTISTEEQSLKLQFSVLIVYLPRYLRQETAK